MMLSNSRCRSYSALSVPVSSMGPHPYCLRSAGVSFTLPARLVVLMPTLRDSVVGPVSSVQRRRNVRGVLLHRFTVPAQARRAVAARPMMQCLLAGLDARRATPPGLERRVLQRPSVREAHAPRPYVGPGVHGVEVRARGSLVLSAGKEDDAGHGGGHV